MMKNKIILRVLAVLLPIQWLIIQFISSKPEFIERFYSTSLYLCISRFFRIIFGWVPFSVGDVLYVIAGYLILKGIIKTIKKRKLQWLKILAQLSIIYFCFHLLWGLNYFRQPLHKSLEINSLEYTTEELESFTDKLIVEINKIHFSITQNDTLKVIVPLTKKEVYTKVVDGYKILSEQHQQFEYKSVSSKNSLISLPLTYMGFSGYLNPFTGEAQVNSLNPMVTYPATSCHEVAHQLGYAAENEANFIGFLSAINNENIYFKYSGYYMALRYALNDLYGHDKELYKTTIAKVNKGILINMRESYEFWNLYQNPFEIYFKKIFNQFLKANKQVDGIKSYSRMIAMIINYNKQHPFVN